jgi:hypothetical protein
MLICSLKSFVFLPEHNNLLPILMQQYAGAYYIELCHKKIHDSLPIIGQRNFAHGCN